MTLSFNTSYVVIALCVLSAAALSLLMYKFTVPRISHPLRYVLIVLRTSAMSLILISVFEPLLSIRSSKEEKAPIALLIDNSLSISLTDKTGNREAAMQKILSSRALERLNERTSLQPFAFSDKPSRLPFDSLKINGGVTDISNAIEGAQKLSSRPLKGIILVSDGDYNTGSNPIYLAEKSPIPIYTVGVGDSLEQKDLAVSSIITNSIGYVGTALPVDAVVTTSGIAPGPVQISLMEDGKRVDQKTVHVGAAGEGVSESRIHFSYVPASDGVKKISVTAASIPGEVTLKNNDRSVAVKILKNKINIVVIAGAPSPDVAAVMQSLHDDRNVEATLYDQRPDGELITLGQPSNLVRSLSSADCVLFVGFPTRFTPESALESIVSIVQSKGSSSFFISGRMVSLTKLRMLEPILPLTVIGRNTEEQDVEAVVSSKFRYNALVLPSASSSLFSWDKLPPIYSSLSTFSSKKQAQVLLTLKVHGIELSSPLFISLQTPRSKELAFTGYGLYRWKLLASSVTDTRDFFSSWFPALVRWLATKDNDPFFRIDPSEEFYSQGEPIAFTGQLYNENYEPIDNADIRIAVQNSSHQRTSDISMHTLGNGRYEATASGLPQGEYTFVGISMRGGDTVSTTRGQFSVGEQSIEFTETKMNKPLLEQIAERSGGAYYDANSFDSLVTTIVNRNDMQPTEDIQTSEMELWNIPSFLTLIIALFGVEWIIRKRNGML